MIRSSFSAIKDIPKDWEAVQIKDIAKVTVGGKLGLRKNNDYCAEGYPAYSAAGKDGFVPQYEYDTDGVIVSSIGARCGKCFYATGKWTSLANTQLILTNEKRCFSRFLWYMVNDELYWHRSGTAQPFIKPTDIRNSWIPLPSLKEQVELVAFLDKLYKPASRHERLVDLHDTLYRGLLQKLREDMFDTTFVQTAKLKNIAKLSMGETLIKKNLSSSGIPVFSANTDDAPWGYTQKNKRVYSRGTIILSARGSIGFPRLPNLDSFTSTQTTIAVQGDSSVLPSFLQIYLQTIDYKLLTTVQAVPMLTIADMNEITVQFPSLEKQQEIVQIFHATDRLRVRHKNLMLAQKKLHEGIKKELLYGSKRVCTRTKAEGV